MNKKKKNSRIKNFQKRNDLTVVSKVTKLKQVVLVITYKKVTFSVDYLTDNFSAFPELYGTSIPLKIRLRNYTPDPDPYRVFFSPDSRNLWSFDSKNPFSYSHSLFKHCPKFTRFLSFSLSLHF